jgi:L-malate glycosyltransferase
MRVFRVPPTSAPSDHQLRVAIVAASLRILGGQAIQAQRLLDGWSNDPNLLAWLVPIDPRPPGMLASVVRVKYVRTIVTQLLYWPLLVRELRRADVVHVFSASYTSFLLSPLPAVVVGRLMGKPVIVHYHSGEAPDHLRRSPVARWTLKRVDRNVVPSAFLRDVFAGFDIPADIVPNTINLHRFAYRVRDPLEPRLLSTRNLEPLYNVACTLRAFHRIQARYPNATLIVVGHGSEAARLKMLAIELGLRNVTFTGPVAPDQIHQYYARSDIYIQTPSIDNMPNSLIEAFASGLPVVSTRVGGVPDILAHGVHGFTADDDDDEAVAAHVVHLVEHPDEARRMAAAARDRCAAGEWSHVREAWLAIYQSLSRAILPAYVHETAR